MSSSLKALERRSDTDIVRTLKKLVVRDREQEAELLGYLGEMDARGLYREEGCPSMHDYCTRVLRFCDAQAYNRIHAARLARKHPEILPKLRRGELHLSGINQLGAQLTRANSHELLELATRKSKREIERLLADREPVADAPPQVRRLPSAPSGPQGEVARPAVLTPPPRPKEAREPLDSGFIAPARVQARRRPLHFCEQGRKTLRLPHLPAVPPRGPLGAQPIARSGANHSALPRPQPTRRRARLRQRLHATTPLQLLPGGVREYRRSHPRPALAAGFPTARSIASQGTRYRGCGERGSLG